VVAYGSAGMRTCATHAVQSIARSCRISNPLYVRSLPTGGAEHRPGHTL